MNGSSDIRSELTHRQAFEWLQLESDGHLDDAVRLVLNRHLQACPQCCQNESFQRRLPELMHARTAGRRTRLSETGDQCLVQAALRARKRQRWLVQPVQGAVWVAMTLLLALIIGWGIERLQPGSASPASGNLGWLFSPPSAPGEAHPIQTVATWKASMTDVLLILAGFIVIWLVLLVFLRRSLGGRLAVLLAGLAGSFGLFFYFASANVYQGNLFYALLFLPLVVLFLVVFFAYLWFNRRQWSLITWLALFLSMIVLGVIVSGAWYGQSLDTNFSGSFLLVILGFSLLPVFIWQVLDLPGSWRWITRLVAAVWVVGALLYLLATYAVNLHLPAWLVSFEQIAGGLFPFFAAVSAGWLIESVLVDHAPSRTKIFFHLVAGLLLFASLYAVLRMMAIETSTNEDPISGVVLLIFAVLGAVIGWTAMVIHLTRRRMLVGVALLATFVAALVPAVLFSPDQSAAVTQARAGTIDRAIHSYYQEKGIYPPNLDALSPGYLLLVPRPVANLTDEWCYVSGGDYYRLGYPYPTKFAYPGSVMIVEINGGNLPSGKSECEAVRNQWIENRY